MNDRGRHDLAMRALRDCGVIRANAFVGAYPELWRKGLVTHAAITGPDADRKRDYPLNAAGIALAAQLKPWEETTCR